MAAASWRAATGGSSSWMDSLDVDCVYCIVCFVIDYNNFYNLVNKEQNRMAYTTQYTVNVGTACHEVVCGDVNLRISSISARDTFEDTRIYTVRNWFYPQNIPVGYFAYTHAYIHAYTWAKYTIAYNYPIFCTVKSSSWFDDIRNYSLSGSHFFPSLPKLHCKKWVLSEHVLRCCKSTNVCYGSTRWYSWWYNNFILHPQG